MDIDGALEYVAKSVDESMLDTNELEQTLLQANSFSEGPVEFVRQALVPVIRESLELRHKYHVVLSDADILELVQEYLQQ